MNCKKNNYKIVYIGMVILGTLFILLSCFHSSMWFDESYSIALAKHSFKEIWQIGRNDVHPVLYYVLLRFIMLFTNNSIVCARLFSCVPLTLMSILGYSFMRKEFGNKVGLIFTFLSLTFPTILVYAGEIRMYTWTMLFVTLMFIYAYKITKNCNKYTYKTEFYKNWILFTMFSLASAYTHYYSLLIAAIINIGLFIYFCKNTNSKSAKKVSFSKNLTSSIISAIIQIILYLPWISVFIKQTEKVSHGFWIRFPTPLDVIEFIFTGNIGDGGSLQRYIAIPFSLCEFIFLIYLIVKNWKKKGNRTNSIKIIISIWTLVIAIMSFVSLIMRQSVFYQRYLFTLIGLLLIGISILLSDENKKVIAVYCTIHIIVSTILNINLININYDKSNIEPINYFKNELKNEDWILINDGDYNGYVSVATTINDFSKVINYDVNNWNVKEAYKCYGDTIISLDELGNIKGRMWIITGLNSNLPNEILNKYNAKFISSKEFKTRYKNYEYKFTLVNLH